MDELLSVLSHTQPLLDAQWSDLPFTEIGNFVTLFPYRPIIY
jgi:hypothetical protein